MLDPHSADSAGYTPAMIARERGFPQLSQMLASATGGGAAGAGAADAGAAGNRGGEVGAGKRMQMVEPVGKLVEVE